MASEKENMQALKTLGAAVFAVGLVCAELLVSGCGAPPEDAQDLGQTSEAFIAQATYGELFGANGNDANFQDGQCHTATGWPASTPCEVPQDKTLLFKNNLPVTSPSVHHGIDYRGEFEQAVSLMQSSIGPNWSIHTGGSSNSESANERTGSQCGGSGFCAVSTFGNNFVSGGLTYKTMTTCSIFVDMVAQDVALEFSSNAIRHTLLSNLYRHEIGHCLGRGHNAASTLMSLSGGDPHFVNYNFTSTEFAEIRNYIFN